MTTPPPRRYRVLLPQSARFVVSGSRTGTKYYPTKKARDIDAQRLADETGEDVLCELWDANHPQDELNAGWGMDKVVRPNGKDT